MDLDNSIVISVGLTIMGQRMTIVGGIEAVAVWDVSKLKYDVFVVFSFCLPRDLQLRRRKRWMLSRLQMRMILHCYYHWG